MTSPCPPAAYRTIVEQHIPKHMRQKIRPEDIARKHREHPDLTEQECNEAYMAFIRQWPFYGSTVFDVLQAYTTTLPKNLWLAVNENGIHILRRRDKEPLVTYEYKNIVNYRLVRSEGARGGGGGGGTWDHLVCIVVTINRLVFRL